MAGNALQIRVAVNEMLEDLVLLLIAGLQGHAVLPVAFGMIRVVLPQVIRLNAEQHIDIGQALGAVVAGLLPAPERGAEVAVKADGQALLLGGAQAAQDEIRTIFVQRRGDAGQVQPVKAVEQLVQIDLRQVVLGQGAVHTVINDLAGADAVAGLQIVGAQTVAGGLLFGGEDHRRAVYVVAAQPAHSAFAQRVVGHDAEEGGIHAEVRQRQRDVGLAAAVAGLKGGGHADLLIVRRGQTQHHLADGDEFLRAVVAHQDRIAVFHLEFLLFLPYFVSLYCTTEGADLQAEKRKICAVSFLTRDVGGVPDAPRRKPPLSKGGAERKRGGGIPGRLRV